VGFAATAVQPETATLLPGSAITWYLNGASTPVYSGSSFSHTFTGAGTVTVLVRATNAAGLSATRTLTLHILSGSGGTGTVKITGPKPPNTSFPIPDGSSSVAVAFTADVTGGLSVRWYDDTTGGTQIGTGANMTANLADPNPTCGTTHHIRAVGYNGSHTQVASDTIAVYVYHCIP
jgi:hypothetical protein